VAFLAREAILSDPTQHGSSLCGALGAATDSWLQRLFAEATRGSTERLALVAVGGYGRGELSPWSDLDLVLLHEGRRGPADIAQQLWYPIWDAKLKLGHAVRTIKEALSLAGGDLDTATALLDCRHIAGDPALTERLARESAAQWQKRSKVWLERLGAAVDERHAAAGEVAFLLEPNVKDGRGGLRDVHSLRWADVAAPMLARGDEAALDAAYETLLATRVELHRLTGRATDVLALQDQDAVAARLGHADGDALMAAVAAAARTIAWTSDEAWHRLRRARRAGATSVVLPVAPGIVERDGDICLAPEADPVRDPTVLLRVATAAARRHTRIERDSLDRLAAEVPEWPSPWPAGASGELVALLLEGHSVIPVLESLDQRDLLVRVLPEWAPVRAKPQRNAYHRFTVDRHLWETAANAAELAKHVHRPDLLVLGALFHDIGKGLPGDHTENGIELMAGIGQRIGLSGEDTELLQAVVRHHLLLPDVATRRDLSDDGTITSVASAIGSPLLLELLDALTEADSVATGPSAWGTWKAELVRDLVERVGHVLGGGALEEVTWSLFPSAEVLARMAEGRTWIDVTDDRVTVVAPDRPGLFSRIAGVLTLHGLDVLGAQAHSDEQGVAASEFRVALPDGRDVPAARVAEDLSRAFAGQLAIDARLAERARAYRRRRAASAHEVRTRVEIDNELSSNATVVEVHALDRVGVLYRITKALADVGLDIRHARVQTLGTEVVDSFSVRTSTGKVTDPFHLAELERAVLHAIAPE
jgi:[protein-PII] uridylyltransferase